MLSVPAFANSFTKEEDSNENVEFMDAKVKSNESSYCDEIATLKEPQKCSLTSINEMSQSICLFKKYLITEAQNNVTRTMIEESAIMKESPPDSISVHVPKSEPRFQRQASALAQKLRPEMSTAYNILWSAINVYDNMPVDKAQAIMLLASESSSSNIAGTKMPKTDTEASPYRSNATLVNKPNVLES